MRLALPAALCGRCASLCLPRRKVAGRPKKQARRRKRFGHEEHARAGGLAGGFVRRRMDWFAIHAGGVVRRARQTFVESAQLDLRTRLNCTLCADGGGGLAGLATGRIQRRRDSVGPVCLTTRTQCALVIPFLWTASVGYGLVRHPSPVERDSGHRLLFYHMIRIAGELIYVQQTNMSNK